MGKKYRFIIFFALILSVFAVIASAANDADAANQPERTYIVDFKDDVTLFSADSGERFNILTESELKECLKAGIVAYYEEDYEVELLGSAETAAAVTSSLKWDLEMIRSARAEDIGCSGQEITVCVIDSGVSPHPDLADSIKPGYNYVSKNTDVTDTIGHGTFVCGLITANQNSQGIVGIAQNTSIIPLKCFDDGFRTPVSLICAAIDEAVNVYGCDIISMSLGVTSKSQKLSEVVADAVSKGVIVIAAAGNKGTSEPYYPASLDGVISVGSVNKNRERSSFSEYNDKLFIMAPGEQVWSTDKNGTYSKNNGTSFATPLVTGTVALMMNIEEGLTYEKITEYLKNSAVDLGDEGYDIYYGHGLLDVEACVELMLRDVDFFISPITVGENKSGAVILNNTDTEFNGYCMWGKYEGKAMTDMDFDSVGIAPSQTVFAESVITDGRIKCFLWSSPEDITTISNVREFEEK